MQVRIFLTPPFPCAATLNEQLPPRSEQGATFGSGRSSAHVRPSTPEHPWPGSSQVSLRILIRRSDLCFHSQKFPRCGLGGGPMHVCFLGIGKGASGRLAALWLGPQADSATSPAWRVFRGRNIHSVASARMRERPFRIRASGIPKHCVVHLCRGDTKPPAVKHGGVDREYFPYRWIEIQARGRLHDSLDGELI